MIGVTTEASATAGDPVTLTIDEGVATITLDSAATRNTIDMRSSDAVIAAIDRILENSNVRVILVRANGPMFCPGASMEFLRPDLPGMDTRVDTLLEKLNPALARLSTGSAVIVAVVHGAVAGGGFGLMNLADLVLAADDTRFSLAYSSIGATPDLGASWYLPRLLGERRALELLLLSETFDAHRALALGLVNAVHPRAEIDDAAVRLTARLRDGPASAHAAVKRLVRAAHTTTLTQHLDAERQEIVAASRGLEFAEGVRAFVERRKPKFSNPTGDTP